MEDQVIELMIKKKQNTKKQAIELTVKKKEQSIFDTDVVIIPRGWSHASYKENF